MSVSGTKTPPYGPKCPDASGRELVAGTADIASRQLDRLDREKISEIIFALPTDVEGETTTNYLVDLLKGKPVTLTRIARGIPAGGGLESADELTLYQALLGRTKL